MISRIRQFFSWRKKRQRQLQLEQGLPLDIVYKTDNGVIISTYLEIPNKLTPYLRELTPIQMNELKDRLEFLIRGIGAISDDKFPLLPTFSTLRIKTKFGEIYEHPFNINPLIQDALNKIPLSSFREMETVINIALKDFAMSKITEHISPSFQAPTAPTRPSIVLQDQEPYNPIIPAPSPAVIDPSPTWGNRYKKKNMGQREYNNFHRMHAKELLEMSRKGHSIIYMAKKLDYSPASIYKWVKDHGKDHKPLGKALERIKSRHLVQDGSPSQG